MLMRATQSYKYRHKKLMQEKKKKFKIDANKSCGHRLSILKINK